MERRKYDYRNVLYGFYVEDRSANKQDKDIVGTQEIEDNAVPEDFYSEDMVIYLTIEGTEYSNVEVLVSDPNKTIQEEIENIIKVFELPRFHNDGITPRQYLLGIMEDNDEEPRVLEFEDEKGRKQSILDYDIRPGAHLRLEQIPLYGCFFDANENQKKVPFYKRWFRGWKK